ncbi:MAG TPA: porin family protein [Longimicrobiales bacterium]|nr:porin family protein [Longimicrobiales bacterium]
MRRTFISFIAGAAFIGFAGAAEAQTIGFKLGASISKVTTEQEDEGIDSRTAFSGGGFMRFGMGRIGIQPELMFMGKGYAINDVSGDDDLELKLDYVEIPVLVHLPLSMGTTFSPYVFGGPAFAFEINCEATNGSVSFDCDEDGTGIDRKKTDIGLTAGGGLAFAMGPGALLVEGRYTFGMTNINQSGLGELKNRSAFIAAGYSIPLGRTY